MAVLDRGDRGLVEQGEKWRGKLDLGGEKHGQEEFIGPCGSLYVVNYKKG